MTDYDSRFWDAMDYLLEVYGNQVGAAEAMRINRASFYQIRKGETAPTSRHAALLAVALDLPVDLIDTYLAGRLSLDDIKNAHGRIVETLVSQIRSLPFDQQLRIIHEVTRTQNES